MERITTYNDLDTIWQIADEQSVEELVGIINYPACLDYIKELENGKYLIKSEYLEKHFYNIDQYYSRKKRDRDTFYYICTWRKRINELHDWVSEEANKEFYLKVIRIIDNQLRIIIKEIRENKRKSLKLTENEIDDFLNENAGISLNYLDDLDCSDYLPQKNQPQIDQQTTQETTTNTKEYSYIKQSKLALYKGLLTEYEEAKVITKQQDGSYLWNKNQIQFVLFCTLLQLNDFLEDENIQWKQILQDFACEFNAENLSSKKSKLSKINSNSMHEIADIFNTNGLKTKNFIVEGRKEKK